MEDISCLSAGHSFCRIVSRARQPRLGPQPNNFTVSSRATHDAFESATFPTTQEVEKKGKKGRDRDYVQGATHSEQTKKKKKADFLKLPCG